MLDEETFSIGSLKALIFDVDGTLYRQDVLRRAMFVHLLRKHATNPLRVWQTAKILQAYRRAQEYLRASALARNVGSAQISLASERAHVNRDVVVACVTRWIEQEPLAFLPRCTQPGLMEFLRACKARGLRLGTLSDYPADAKLEALGIVDFFDVVLSAQHPDIDVFKPDPRGLLLAIERLGAGVSESLYVGDRFDVDAVTANRAGVRCAIVSSRRSTHHALPLCFRSYTELHDRLFG
jgi:HAD superfamily hydrolase (TIGR01549 family)